MDTLPAGHFLLLHDDLRSSMMQDDLGVLALPSGRLALNGGYAPMANEAVEAEIAVPPGQYRVQVLTVSSEDTLRQWHVGVVVNDRRPFRAAYLADSAGKIRLINRATNEVCLIDAAGIEALAHRPGYDPNNETWLEPYDEKYNPRIPGNGIMVSSPDRTLTAALAYADDTSSYGVIIGYDETDQIVWAGVEALCPWHPQDYEREPNLIHTVAKS